MPAITATVLDTQRPRLTSYLRNRCALSAEDAADAAQDTIIRAWQRRAQYDPRRPLDPWLFRVAANIATDLRRKRHTLPLDLADLMLQAPDDAALDRLDNLDRLARAVAAVRPPYRRVALMVWLQDMAYNEVADTLHCNIGTVRSRVHRARQQARAAVGEG